MGKLDEFRDYVNQMVDGVTPFPVDQESHDAIHALSVEIFQRVGQVMLESIADAMKSGDMGQMIGTATQGPVAVGCSMFRIGYRLGSVAGAEAVSAAREQLDLMEGAGDSVIPCTCADDKVRWWTGKHRPPTIAQSACPRWGGPPRPRWQT